MFETKYSRDNDIKWLKKKNWNDDIICASICVEQLFFV